MRFVGSRTDVEPDNDRTDTPATITIDALFFLSLAPMHGKPSVVNVRGGRLFEGLPGRFEGGRYHSLHADRGTFPQVLQITAESDDGIVMAVEHPDLPVAAVQFHPESILTLDEDAGMAVVTNVMRGLGRQSRLSSFLR